MICSNCDLRYKSTEIFCANCGQGLQPIQQQPVPSIQPPVQQVRYEKSPKPPKVKKEKQPLTKKKKIAITISLVIVIALVVGGIRAKAYFDDQRATLATQTVVEAFDSETLVKFLPACGTLDSLINDEDLTDFIALSKKTSQIKTANRAISFDKSNDVPTEKISIIFVEDLKEVIETKLEEMLAESDRDEKAKSPQIVEWKEQWFEKSLTNCNFYTLYSETKMKLEAADQEFVRFNNLVAMGPEEEPEVVAETETDTESETETTFDDDSPVPAGYTKQNNNLAYKFADGSPSPTCVYGSCYGSWAIDVMTNIVCSMGVSVSLTTSPDGNVLVGYTGQSVFPGQSARIYIDNMTPGVTNGRVTSMSCE